MKTVFIMLCMVSEMAIADNPNAVFDATNNMTNKASVEWVQVDDVQKVCDGIAEQKLNKKFGYRVESCASWKEGTFGFTCTIYTGKKTTMATLGHEIRHCFQGEFHK